MSNILDAIMNIIEDGTFEAGRSKKTNNTVNQVGSPLEEYVKDAFSNSFHLEVDKRDEAMKKVFYTMVISPTRRTSLPPEKMVL